MKINLCKPIDELELKDYGISTNVYKTTYNYNYTTETTEMNRSLSNFKTYSKYFNKYYYSV